ncbi:hypothetical protein [Methanobacterium sp. ACI-7]|uniref:hypothetical protein n=1 Tax=unclassified Methanobacterium TaxID=2627676 RepID=UPI0039C4BA3F
MPYLVCKKCNGYYELQKGESVNDFEECECGGTLKQVDHLNIPYNKDRVKVIIETFKTDSRYFQKPDNSGEKLSINVDYSDGINRLLKEDKSSKKQTPKELQRSTLKEVASISELYNFDYIDPLDDDKRLKIIETIAEAVYEGKGIIDAANKIMSRTSLNYDDAMHISKNEINRVKNLAAWYINKERGYKYFKISKSFNACKECNKAYDNILFNIEQVEMLPPLHDLCKCNAIFYKE